MAKQTFVADAILTAAQMNALQGNDFNQTVSTKTASYVLVASDAGTKIVMNSASATTITVNTSLFAAGDNVTILNISSGVCTVTAGTATVSTAGTLALVANAGGTLYFTSAGVSVFQADGVAASASGLTFITGTTFSAVTSVSLPANTFSSTYANYKVVFDVTAASVNDIMRMRLRAAGTDSSAASYTRIAFGYSGAGALFNSQGIGATDLVFGYFSTAAGNALIIDVVAPQATSNTKVLSHAVIANATNVTTNMDIAGLFTATTSFDSMSLYPDTGTITGSYKVYGYANS